MLKIKTEDRDHVAVVHLSGEFAGEASEQLRRTIIERLDTNARDFVLDFDGVEIIDSRGLETLLWVEERTAERLGQVRVAATQGDLATVFHITRMNQRFPASADVDAALATFAN